MFGGEGAQIQHKDTGRTVRLHKKGNAFVMRVQATPASRKPNENDCTQSVAMLDDVGLVWQKD